jgi:uncharacterized protein
MRARRAQRMLGGSTNKEAPMTSTTVTEHPNATVVRSLYAAVNRKDMDVLTALFGPDVTLLMPGRSPLAGLYSGRDALFGFFGRLAQASNGTYHAELRELYTGESSVVAIHHGTGTNGDRTLDATGALMFELTDGVVTAVTVHHRNQDGWDDFFS